jgi:heme-degrading monooxygenase HmoA
MSQKRETKMAQIKVAPAIVTQITIVETEPGKQAEVLSLMTKRSRFMATQPGFVGISLHRSLDGRRVINYIQWASREQLQAAHHSPDFRDVWRHFDQVTDDIDAHLYAVIEVIDGDGATLSNT